MFFKSPQNKRLKVKAFLSLPILIFSGMFLAVAVTKAEYTHDSGGWGWGGSQDLFTSTTAGLGWISTNSTDCDLGGDGSVSAAEAALTGCSEGVIADYGIDIPGIIGNPLSGYAWSENYGWISFNRDDLSGCPAGACAAVRRSSTEIAGWARILSLRIGGTTSGGWIRLASEIGDTVTYGVTVDHRSMEFGGYAYSDEVGWIDFSPIPDSVIGDISVEECFVALDESDCNGSITWDLQEGTSPYEVVHDTTGTVLGNSSTTATTSFVMVYGTNQITASAAGLYPAVWTGSVECEAGLFFHSGLGTPVCKQPPEVSIVTPIVPTRISRQQSMVDVDFGVLANYDVTCNVYGSVPSGTNVVHAASPSLRIHTFTTDPLLSAQTIEVECGVAGIPESYSSSTVRIDVVPSYQER